MKKIIAFIFCGITFVCGANAESININWIVDGETRTTTTCNIGDDLIIPNIQTPTKYGYDFVGWRVNAVHELEYVRFQSTAYIDTGIKFDSDSIEYETGLGELISYRFVFGASGTCSGNSLPTADSAGSIQTGGNNYRGNWAAGTRRIAFDGATGPINIYKLYIDRISKTVIANKDGTETVTSLTGTPTADKNILLGQVSANNTFCNFNGIMYYFKIKQDGVLVRDLIPVLDSDGIACFYDRITKTLFYTTGPALVPGPLKE